MSHCWLIGTGNMALQYAKVLQSLAIEFTVIGRSAQSASAFKKATGCANVEHSVSSLQRDATPLDTAIIAISASALAEMTSVVINANVKTILVEKPLAFTPQEINPLAQVASQLQVKIYIAFNRRFYNSTRYIREAVISEGGITSFNFEFTEWSDKIGQRANSTEKALWMWMNSFHVIDLAFHLGGRPNEMHTFTSGALDWHPAGAIFCGSGVTENNILFSYISNWDAPGRWGLEFCTRNTRYILRPMEKLSIIKRGSIDPVSVSLGNEDKDYKPGLLRQVIALLTGEGSEHLCTLEDQQSAITLCQKIAPAYWSDDH